MGDYNKTMRDWNTIQAFFYELSQAVEVMFVCHIASIFVTFVFFARERAVEHVSFTTSTYVFGPLLVLALLPAHVLISSSALTETCMRAPSVINSMTLKGGR